MVENKANRPQAEGEQDLREILRIRRDKLKELQESGSDPFQITKYEADNDSANIKANFDALEGQPVSIAGRMMSKRGMGKVSFCDLQDRTGRIQLYARKDEMDEEEYNRFKKFDIGDILGVKGVVFRTQRGEMSVRVEKVTLLSKSLLPLPEKYHGLKDTDARYRQRYVDLIMNPEVKQTFVLRSRFIKFVRDFLDARGYMEVETPVLNTISGGATARPFITHHNTLDIDMYMRIATELPLKRLIVGGLDRVYELGRIFRNEGMDPKHNPEFTTVELYQAYADFNDMMDLFEELLSSAARSCWAPTSSTWQGEQIDLTPGWPRLTMAEAVKQYTGLDFMAISGDEEAVAAAKSVGVELPPTADPTWGNALYEVFDQKVEEKLIQPTFITMHPVDVSPLAKRSPEGPAPHGAVRAVHLPQRDGQRLQRAQRPHRPARPLPEAGGAAGQGRRRGGHDGRGLPHRPRVRHAPHGRPGHRHRPLRDDAHQLRHHPGGHPVPHDEASGPAQGGEEGRNFCLRRSRGSRGPHRLLQGGDRAPFQGFRGL